MPQKTRKIEIEIYEDKIAEFYVIISAIKSRKKPNPLLLNRLVDTIHLDLQKVSRNLTPNQNQIRNINRKLRTVHGILILSGKNSPDYIKVSKGNFKDFLESDFIKSLVNIISLNETFTRLYAEEKKVDVNASLASLALFYVMIGHGFSQTFEKQNHASIQTSRSKSKTRNKKKGLLDLLTKNEHENLLKMFLDLKELYSQSIKLRTTPREHNDFRDKMILNVFSDLKSYYPEIHSHVGSIITGHILAQMGLLDTEKLHALSEKTGTYQKYLLNSVYRVIVKYKLI